MTVYQMFVTTPTLLLFFFSYATGCLLYTHYFIYALLCSLIASYSIFFEKKYTLLAVALLSCFLGFVRMHMLYEQQKTITQYLGTPSTIIGTLQDYYQASNPQDNSRLLLHVDYIVQDKEYKKIDQPVCIYFNQNCLDTNFVHGCSYVLYKVTLYQPKDDSSFRLYTLKESYWALANKPWLYCKKLDTPVSWFFLFLQYRQQVIDRIHKKCSEKTHKFLSAIFYGKKEDTLSYAPDFQAWGLSHYLARAGLHISLLIGIFLFLFCLIPCSYRIKYILCTFLLLGYASMTFNSISFLRAFSNFFLCLFSIFLYKNIISLRFLILIALSFVLYNPAYLFFLDFQLSFGCTLLIFWFFSCLQKNIAV